MNFYLLLLLSIASGFKTNPKKFCINCRHFINTTPETPENAKCSLFTRTSTDYLVTGEESEKMYYFASTARQYSDMCGEEGTLYKRKVQPRKKYEPKEEHSY